MTKEEKQLLLKDLCARLPYGVKINIYDDYSGMMKDEELNVFHLNSTYNIEYKKLCPYLRPLFSMTEKERKELSQISEEYLDDWSTADSNLLKWKLDAKVSSMRATFYNSHYLDWNGLIPQGLALEAPEGMYKNL